MRLPENARRQNIDQNIDNYIDQNRNETRQMPKKPPVRMLPEWTPQWGVMLTWPHAATDWAGWLAEVERVYGEMAREITAREHLLVVAQDPGHGIQVRNVIRRAGGNLDRVRLAFAPSNDTWARDHGPITVKTGDGELLLKNFIFNGWGSKWPAELDDRINRTLADTGTFTVAIDNVPRVMEGGALESDGLGTIMTTRQCLLAPTRNPSLDEAGVTGLLQEHLGAERVLWLDHGHLEGDDTDSHIDTLARFADPATIVFQGCDDRADPHFEELAAMRTELEAFRTADGQPYRLLELPWPRAQHDPVTGDRLPATYANFLIINGAVLVPGYDDPADSKARKVLANAFPDRDIVMIDCRPVIRGFGSLHCLTMQLPTGSMAEE